MSECCKYGVDRGWRHFFYGGKSGVPELLKKNFRTKYPGFKTAGTFSPPFTKLTYDEDQSIVKMINKTQPDVLWIGLGLIKQEVWIKEHLGRIKVPWMIGVGAAFDFHAGTIRRAPRAYRKIGLEWLYRLYFEPRMLKRNYYSLILFAMAMKYELKQRKYKNIKQKGIKEELKC